MVRVDSTASTQLFGSSKGFADSLIAARQRKLTKVRLIVRGDAIAAEPAT